MRGCPRTESLPGQVTSPCRSSAGPAAPFVPSDRLQVVKGTAGKYYLLHSQYGRLSRVGSGVLRFLHLTKRRPAGELLPVESWLLDRGFLVVKGSEQGRAWRTQRSREASAVRSGSCWHLLRLSLTTACNLRCHYCYLGQAPYSTSEWMSEDVARESIRAFFENLPALRTKAASIWLYGGEPLLAPRLTEAILDLIGDLSVEAPFQPAVEVTTNGTIFHPSLARGLRECAAQVTVSVDGVGHYHDEARTTSNGSGSFATVDRNIRRYLRNGIVPIASAVLTPQSVGGLSKLVDYCSDLGLRGLSVDRAMGMALSDNEVSLLVDGLLDAWRHADARGLHLDGFWRSSINALLDARSWKYCAAMGEELNIQPDGTIQPCPGIRVPIGTVANLRRAFAHPFYLRLAEEGAGNHPSCLRCPFTGFCKGGCVAERKPTPGEVWGPEASPHCRFVRELVGRVLHTPALMDRVFSPAQAPRRQDSSCAREDDRRSKGLPSDGGS